MIFSRLFELKILTFQDWGFLVFGLEKIMLIGGLMVLIFMVHRIKVKKR